MNVDLLAHGLVAEAGVRLAARAASAALLGAAGIANVAASLSCTIFQIDTANVASLRGLNLNNWCRCCSFLLQVTGSHGVCARLGLVVDISGIYRTVTPVDVTRVDRMCAWLNLVV